jgi:hypothetical protein
VPIQVVDPYGVAADPQLTTLPLALDAIVGANSTGTAPQRSGRFCSPQGDRVIRAARPSTS